MVLDGAVGRGRCRQLGEPLERRDVAAIERDDALVLPRRRVAPLERTLEEVRQAPADRQLPRRLHGAGAIERRFQRGGREVPAVGAPAEIEEAIDGVAPARRQLDLAERLDRGGGVVELDLLQRRQLQLQLGAAIVVELRVRDQRGEQAAASA